MILTLSRKLNKYWIISSKLLQTKQSCLSFDLPPPPTLLIRSREFNSVKCQMLHIKLKASSWTSVKKSNEIMNKLAGMQRLYNQQSTGGHIITCWTELWGTALPETFKGDQNTDNFKIKVWRTKITIFSSNECNKKLLKPLFPAFQVSYYCI